MSPSDGNIAQNSPLATLRDAEMLRAFVRHMPIAVAMFDTELRYLAASDQWYRAYKLPPESIIGRSHYDVFPEIPEHWREDHRRNLAGEALSGDEDPFLRADGRTDYVRWSNVPWYENDGSIGGLIMFTEVVTEAVQARHATIKALEAAKSANQAKAIFISNMSHELRTPLNGILGMAQVLQYAALDDENAAHVETILSCGTALQSIINTVLDLSRIEAGEAKLSHAPFDLDAVLSEICTQYSPCAQAKGLRLTYSRSFDGPGVFVSDAERLKEVLDHLCSNAIKFTETGQVALTVERFGRGTLRFCVTDTGPGIAKSRQKHIFERFFQVDGSATRKHGGTGLGLAISRDIVGMMGGRIGVDSEEGKGATFWFDVPMAEAAENHPATCAQAVPG